ncbi:MAG TPA: alpha/beta fold hydrolase [Vicinamibacteria bacterium]|nr:alpha/beta fold hydrolase [Vicinamibacteria bacterium]
MTTLATSLPGERPRADEARFRPLPGMSGGHRQTLLGFWCRRNLTFDHEWERVEVDAGDDVRILLRASWQPGPREGRPALLIVHGLGGADAAGYVAATGLLAYAQGWHVVRMNMRGAGDSLDLCARLYHAGLDADVRAAALAVSRVTPRVALLGFSLGGNQALLALGRSGAALPDALIGAAAVSPPADLAACAAAIDERANRVYQRYFMTSLRESYAERQRRLPDLYAPGRERGLRTVGQYDEAITAPYNGFRDAADYYAQSSAGPHLAAIARPALVLAAEDDPLVPAPSVARWPLPASGVVVREMPPTGGHVGFVGRTRAPGRFWAAERVMRFFTSLVQPDS